MIEQQETWSTHQMRLTLGNIEELYREGRRLAQADPTGEELRDWVGEWFRGDLRHLSGSTGSAIEWLRSNMSEAEWDEIDWESVAEDLGDL